MELALPITVYWDLAADTHLDDSLLRCCNEILECLPLMLQLYDPSLKLGEGVRAVLEQLRGKPLAVSLTLTHSAFSSLIGISANQLGIKELLVACDNLSCIDKIPPDVGLAFFVNSDNWRELPKVVSYFRERALNRLVLPMQRLYNKEEPFLLGRSDQKILEIALKAVGGVDGLPITIHDPFLWRAFNPEIPFPQGGCQAANTMIAIGSDWGVYPCPTLPVRLGKIGSTSLKEIIKSSAKKELRSRILNTPAACYDCLEVALCKGGCRGRSYVKHDSFDGVDDACR